MIRVYSRLCFFLGSLLDNGRFSCLLTSSVIRHDNRFVVDVPSKGNYRGRAGRTAADGRPAPKNAIIIGIGRWVLDVYDRFAGRVLVVKWGPVAKSAGATGYLVVESLDGKRPSRTVRTSGGLRTSTRGIRDETRLPTGGMA